MSLQDALKTDRAGMWRYVDREYLSSDSEKNRMKAAQKRHDLYCNDTNSHFDNILSEVFSNKEVIAARQKFVRMSRYLNVSRRVINKISTVYRGGAERYLGARPTGGSENKPTEVLKILNERTQIDQVMLRAQRMVNLTNACAIYPRVKTDGTPELHAYHHGNFFAVHHPDEPTDLLALIFEKRRRGASIIDSQESSWLFMDSKIITRLQPGGSPSGDVVEHGLGRIPAVLARRDMTSEVLIDTHTGGDIEAAHEAVALMIIMMLKHLKSGTKMPYLAGDTTGMATEQPLDEESFSRFNDGSAPGVLDLGADPSAYLRAAKSIIRDLEETYGIPDPAIEAGSRSGDQIEIQNKRLVEMRAEQIPHWRAVEMDLNDLRSRVHKYEAKDFWISFGEVTKVRTRSEELKVRQEERKLGYSNVVDELIKDNPELDVQGATAAFIRNCQLETLFVAQKRSLNIPSDSTDSQGRSPEENGRLRIVKDSNDQQTDSDDPEDQGDSASA